MIEVTMVSTTEGFNYRSIMYSGPSVTVKQPNMSKYIRQFSKTLDVKPRPDFCRLCAAKSKRKATRSGSMLWYSIKKPLSHTKTNERLKKDIYKYILQYPQVV